MRKIFFGIAFALTLTAVSAAKAEVITGFDTVNRIQADGSVRITETVRYDFESAERHGIYRDIPVRYKTQYGNYSIRLSDISVTDENGSPYRFKLSSTGGDRRIKIGDPDVLISGTHTYVITYTVERVMLYRQTSDQFYWNVTGNGWDVPIHEATAEVIPPQALAPDTLALACYKGILGSITPCDRQGAKPGSDGLTTSIGFSATALGPGEGLTFQMTFPKGVVTEPTQLEKILGVVRDNAAVAIPVMVFILMNWLWRTRGRDPKGRGVIIAEYEPPEGLTPAQVGVLVDESIQNKDIAAEIIQLAVRGYLHIRQDGGEKEYTFFQLKEAGEELLPSQKQLLEGLFDPTKATPSNQPGILKQVALADLKNTFYKTLATVKAAFETSMVTGGYQSGRPTVIRAVYVLAGAVISFFATAVLFQYYSTSSVTAISMVITGFIVVGFGWAMPRRTYQGVLAKEKILGFKEYLRVVETDRIKFHNAPEKQPESFEKFLPYAMVLDVEKEWAAQFKDIYTQEPQWYQGRPGTVFNSVMFASNLNSFASHTGSVMASAPSSHGGGGSSGGGFGGGGGGSW